MLGPAGLDASRHRGLSKSDSAASPPNPRRPARGVLGLLRLAPGGRPVSGDPPFLANWKAVYPPLWAQAGSVEPVTGAVPAITGPGDARLARRDEAAWTAGGFMAPHLRRPQPGHRSPPRVWRR